MRKGYFKACLLAGCFLVATFSATAQEVVHALCGTVRSINPAAKTITVSTDDGSEGVFKDITKSDTSFYFDKRIRAKATTADAFTKNGVKVVVYYFGDSDVRTAVAVQVLGTGPFERSSGRVIKFHHSDHVLTIKNDSGVEESFQVTPKTVAETALGAAEGYELGAKDGDQVQVTSSAVNGGKVALFVRTM